MQLALRPHLSWWLSLKFCTFNRWKEFWCIFAGRGVQHRCLMAPIIYRIMACLTQKEARFHPGKDCFILVSWSYATSCIYPYCGSSRLCSRHFIDYVSWNLWERHYSNSVMYALLLVVALASCLIYHAAARCAVLPRKYCLPLNMKDWQHGEPIPEWVSCQNMNHLVVQYRARLVQSLMAL